MIFLLRFSSLCIQNVFFRVPNAHQPSSTHLSIPHRSFNNLLSREQQNGRYIYIGRTYPLYHHQRTGERSPNHIYKIVSGAWHYRFFFVLPCTMTGAAQHHPLRGGRFAILSQCHPKAHHIAMVASPYTEQRKLCVFVTIMHTYI